MTKIKLKREHSIDVVNNASTSPDDDVKLKSELDPPPHFQDKLPWCSIYYYELDQRYGDPFHGHSPIVKIDGWTNPCDGTRFCLGIITNISRNREIELVRRNIGNGISLIYEQGTISLKNTSDSSIFVQSEQLNIQWKLKPKRVIKIPAGHEADIFDNARFIEQLSQCTGFEALYRLNILCTLRLSFIKGWGDNYRRDHITKTPCWIEICLNSQLHYLDQLLRKMEPPCSTISSSSPSR